MTAVPPTQPATPSPPTRDRVDAVLSAGGPLAGGAEWRDRPAQRALAAAIADAIDARATLVAEAGTGIGKTYAYLVPALLAGGKVIVSTGTKTLQDQLFARDLPRVVRALGLDVSCALLKGRANYVCRHHLRRHLADGRFTRREDVVRLHRIDRFAKLSSTGDRAECPDVGDDDPVWSLATSTRDNCLGQDCADWSACFVVQARRTAQAADVVVVNHHLFCADLALRDGGVAELLPSAATIVFDEAHQLPETLATFFGEASGTRALADLARDAIEAGTTEAPDQARWTDLAAGIERTVRAARAAWPLAAPRAPAHRLQASRAFVDALEAVGQAIDALAGPLETAAERGPALARMAERARVASERWQDWMAGDTGPDAAAEAPWQDDPAPGAAAEAVGAAFGGAPQAVRWAEVHATSLTLHRTPVSVAEPFARHREGPARAWVFVSATLAVGGDFNHFVRALGLSEARRERYASPFDYPMQGLLYVPRHLPEPSDPGFTAALVDDCWPLIEANVGRCFVLCTSLRAVHAAAARLRERIEPPLALLVQGEASRRELLERYRREPAPVLVGAASFWEGVDVAGDALSLLLIDKLPFAPPDDPVLEARSDALRRQGGDPFRAVQLPAAAIALKQGAGRLIRSERDRGVLVIGDARLVTRGYGRVLLESLPPFRLTRLRGDAEAFIVASDQTDAPG